MRSLLSAEGKTRITEAVRAFESVTSAELVVTMRRESGSYRGVAAVVGALFAGAALFGILFLPQSFDINWIPLDILFGFAAGFAVGSVPQVKRLLLPRRMRDRAVLGAAKIAFFDRGVSRTTGRSGIFVYGSVLEGRVRVLCDVGIPAPLVERVEASQGPLARALASGNADQFATELEGWRDLFAKDLPRAADDVNELPDEVA